METADNKAFIYTFGKFALDPADRTLFADGQPLHLPAKEFETLLLLVEHNGKALSKEEMMSAIWRDAFVEESNLAKQVSRLRKILNTNGEEFIETLPKHGYRFTADLHRLDPVTQDSVLLEKRTVKRLTVAFEDDVDVLRGHLPSTGRSILNVSRIVGVAVLAATGVAAVWYWGLRPSPDAGKINTIAVLPLRSLDNDDDDKALGLGLADALITKLASTHRVVVRPTNAVALLDQSTDPAEAGRRLRVDAILEGTIQRADGRLRVNARLLRTETAEQIWTERFEEPTAGIFALQDALSADIAKTLAFEFTKADSQQQPRHGTENTEAYEKYLRGRFYQSQNTPEGLARSIELYQQAAALDQSFAEAHARIADANLILFNFGLRSGAETLAPARQEIDRALQLKPDLSDAYTSLALIQFLGDRSWVEAEKSLQRAIELDPNNADAFLRYGYFLTNVGKFDQALEKLGRAHELNPLSPIVQADIGLAYLCARRYPEAIRQLEKTTAENPQFSLPLWLLGTSYEALGDAERSFAANLRALTVEGSAELAAKLQKVKDADGIDAANRFWLDESVKERRQGREAAFMVALRAATVKDRDQTLFWLEQAVHEGDQTTGGVKYLAEFDFVRDDPRFHALEDTTSF